VGGDGELRILRNLREAEIVVSEGVGRRLDARRRRWEGEAATMGSGGSARLLVNPISYCRFKDIHVYIF
jgi:hypothetical protein